MTQDNTFALDIDLATDFDFADEVFTTEIPGIEELPMPAELIEAVAEVEPVVEKVAEKKAPAPKATPAAKPKAAATPKAPKAPAKITLEAAEAFLARTTFKRSNTIVDSMVAKDGSKVTYLKAYGYILATLNDAGDLSVSLPDAYNKTMVDRISVLPGVVAGIVDKKLQLNGKPWRGESILVTRGVNPKVEVSEPESEVEEAESEEA
jgi:hypothetical protein